MTPTIHGPGGENATQYGHKNIYNHVFQKKQDFKRNKTPAKVFTPPAEKKIGTRWSFVEKINE